MDQTEREIVEGQQAAYILTHPLTTEAFKMLESDIIEQWAACPLRDADGQHELLLMLKVARKFKAIFQSYVDTGEMAQARLNEQTGPLTRADRLRQALGFMDEK